MAEHVPAVLCLLLLVPLLVAESRDHAPTRAIAKIGASLAFVGYALSRGALTDGPAGVVALCGLAVSVIGDAALLWRSRAAFLLGLSAFLVAQACYVLAFGLLGVDHLTVWVAIVPLSLASGVVWNWISPRLGKTWPALLAYMGVITAMVAFAIGALAAMPDPRHLALAIGAVLFYASDVTVARDRFVVREPVNNLVGLPLYYAAQLLIAGFVASASTA